MPSSAEQLVKNRFELVQLFRCLQLSIKYFFVDFFVDAVAGTAVPAMGSYR